VAAVVVDGLEAVEVAVDERQRVSGSRSAR
jgi:hypothetical protein